MKSSIFISKLKTFISDLKYPRVILFPHNRRGSKDEGIEKKFKICFNTNLCLNKPGFSAHYPLRIRKDDANTFFEKLDSIKGDLEKFLTLYEKSPFEEITLLDKDYRLLLVREVDILKCDLNLMTEKMDEFLKMVNILMGRLLLKRRIMQDTSKKKILFIEFLDSPFNRKEEGYIFFPDGLSYSFLKGVNNSIEAEKGFRKVIKREISKWYNHWIKAFFKTPCEIREYLKRRCKCGFFTNPSVYNTNEIFFPVSFPFRLRQAVDFWFNYKFERKFSRFAREKVKEWLNYWEGKEVIKGG